MLRKIFRKEKFLARLKTEGRIDTLTDTKRALLDDIDGKEATPDPWRMSLYEDETIYVCNASNGVQISVKAIDCEDIIVTVENS